MLNISDQITESSNIYMPFLKNFYDLCVNWESMEYPLEQIFEKHREIQKGVLKKGCDFTNQKPQLIFGLLPYRFYSRYIFKIVEELLYI